MMTNVRGHRPSRVCTAACTPYSLSSFCLLGRRCVRTIQPSHQDEMRGPDFTGTRLGDVAYKANPGGGGSADNCKDALR